MLSYRLTDPVKAGELYQRLYDKHRVVVKAVPGQWFNGNRTSTHLFNDDVDLDQLVAALKAELA